MKLFVQKLGQGEPLVILHGLFGSSDNWMTLARSLQDKYTLYLIDQRNHGQSPHHKTHTYESMAMDLQEFVSKENLNTFHLLGHSMGGKTAMVYSSIFPQNLSALVIADITPLGYSRLNEYSPHIISHLNIIQAMLSVDLVHASSRTAIEEQIKNLIPNPSVRLFILKNIHRRSDNTFEWKLNIPAIHEALPAMMGPVLEDKKMYPITGFPVLFLKGEKSDYINSENIPSIFSHYPNAKLVIIPEAGHWLHADQPVLFKNALLDFLPS